MTGFRSELRKAVLLAAVFLVLPRLAWSTTYVLMPDGALLSQADVVARVTLLQELPARQGAAPRTEFTAVSKRLIKGNPQSSLFVVGLPGGTSSAGTELVLKGGPSFETGDDLLLFLVKNRDGTFGVLHGALGAFAVQGAGGDTLAVRSFEEARLLDRSLSATRDVTREFEGFAAWLTDRVRGVDRPADYFVEDRSAPGSKFTLLRVKGDPIRWFGFDDGSDVSWRFRSAGSGGTLGAFRSALAVWSSQGGTRVSLVYGGSTGATGGFTRSDGVNAIVFGDPNGEMPGRFDCSVGGVIAGGGGWTSGRGTVRGVNYRRLVEGDVVVNDGAECLFGDMRSAAEVFTHELGHTLGIGHSQSDNATMRAEAHFDGRGASIRNDDLSALRFLYKDDGGGGGSAPPRPTGVAAPSELVAWSTGPTKLRLRWKDNSRDETAFEIWRKIGGGALRLWRTETAGTRNILWSEAKPETTYTFQVRALRNQDQSAFSNQASVVMPTALTAPKKLKARVIPDAVALRWRDTSPAEIKFQVWVRPAGEEWRLALVLPANTTRATFTEIQSGVTYFFRVRGKRGSRFSDYSRVAEVTVP